MRFVNPIIFVSDIGVSAAFYRDVVGLKIEADHGTIVIFSEHFAIHDAATLTRTVWGPDAPVADGPHGRRNLLLYFEDPDIDGCFRRMSSKVDLIHPVLEQPWGQRVFRFHDPDGYAIEIGEPMS